MPPPHARLPVIAEGWLQATRGGEVPLFLLVQTFERVLRGAATCCCELQSRRRCGWRFWIQRALNCCVLRRARNLRQVVVEICVIDVSGAQGSPNADCRQCAVGGGVVLRQRAIRKMMRCEQACHWPYRQPSRQPKQGWVMRLACESVMYDRNSHYSFVDITQLERFGAFCGLPSTTVV